MDRTVVTLKENKQNSDLEGGTLYAIELEKIPQSLLSQYYRWIKEKAKLESCKELRHWFAEEAEYQVQASEVKHGVSSAREGMLRGLVHISGLETSVTDLASCGTKNIQFGSARC